MSRASLSMLLLAASVSLRAEDSPQFRGPDGNGISKETGLPVNWSQKENIRWKAPLPGRGLSCPIVAGKRVFVTACSGPDQKRLHVICFHADTGDKLWHRQLWATGNTVCHDKTNMAAPTPVTDGKRVYALFATCDLACFDIDGNLVWYRSLEGDYPTVGNNVGMAASPVLCNDLVIVCLETTGASFAAGIDTTTGRNRWKIDRPRIISWVSPIVIKNSGKDEVVFQGPSDLSAHDAVTGKSTWSLKGSFSNIPSPSFGDGMVLVPGGQLQAVRPGKGKSKPEVVWGSAKLSTAYGSPLLYRGLVYTINARGVVNCADSATGRPIWGQRLEGAFAASPLAADGKIYFVSEEGATTVLQAGPEFRVLASNALPDTFLATPVAAAGALFLRSDSNLYCIARTKK